MEELNDTTAEQRIPFMSTQQRRVQTNTDQTQRNYESGDDSAFHSLCTPFTTSNYSDESDDSFNELDSDDSETQEISLESLRTHYPYLLDQMETEGVLDKFHESSIFDDAFLEKCKETPNRRRRVDLIIKEICSIATTKTSQVLEHFALALFEDQSFILEKLKDDSFEESATENSSEHIKFITLMRKRIIRDIDPRTFLHKLVENKTLSLREHEDIVCLLHRKDQVNELLTMAEQENSRSAKVIQSIIDANPKLYKEYQLKAMKEACHSTGGSVGSAIRVKFDMKCENMTETNKRQLKKIEQHFVETYTKEKHKDSDQGLNDLIEDCRCKFEGLKISCIVIQLLTLEEDSILKVLYEVKKGKIVEWFLSSLDESNLDILCQLGRVKLEISVSTDKGGNFNSHISMNDCLCRLHRKLVLENKDKLREIIADETFLKQLEKLNVSTSNEATQSEIELTEEKQSMFSLFEENALPKTAFCILEEQLKSKHPSVLETLLTSNCSKRTDSLPSKSDIDVHNDYLTEELEIRSLMHIIRSFKTEASRKLLDELKKCQSRRARTVRFLEFVKREENITWFWTEIKNRQSYILETIMSSQNESQLESDLLAVRLMNGTIKEDVDPALLWQHMNRKSAEELGMMDFQHITSRKRKAQYMLNRLSLATISEFMTTLRRCGYENLYSEIKAGSLSKHYVCPRIHKREEKEECGFIDQYEIQMKWDGAHYPRLEYTRQVREWSGKPSGEDLYSSSDDMSFRQSYINGTGDERTYHPYRKAPPCVSVPRNDCKYEVCLKKHLKLDVDLSKEGVRHELRKRKCDSFHSQRNPKVPEGRGPINESGEIR